MNGVGRLLMILAIALAAPAWAGTAVLLDDARLADVLKKGEPCCVIDARSEGRRKQQPIPFAVPYKDGVQPKPGGFALVVGDNDQHALEVAQRISNKSGQPVFAVKGGYPTLKHAQSGRSSPAEPETLMPPSFTIPSNTCEQGQALQEFK